MTHGQRMVYMCSILELVRTVFAPMQSRSEEVPPLARPKPKGEGGSRTDLSAEVLLCPAEAIGGGGTKADDNFKFFFGGKLSFRNCTNNTSMITVLQILFKRITGARTTIREILFPNLALFFRILNYRIFRQQFDIVVSRRTNRKRILLLSFEGPRSGKNETQEGCLICLIFISIGALVYSFYGGQSVV